MDLISGLNGSEQIAHKSGSTITLLETGGVTASSYNLCLLDTAPEALGEELREYFSGVSHAEKTGMLIEASRQDTPRQSAAEAGVFGLALAVLLMAAAIALLVRRNRRQRRQIAKNEETDDVTGVGNEAYLNRYWHTCVDDRNRILCSMVTFYIHAGKGQTGSARPDAPEFMRHMADVLRAAAGSGDALARIPGRGFVLLRVSGSGQAAGEWLAPILKEIRDARAGTTVCRWASTPLRRMTVIWKRSCSAASAAPGPPAGRAWISGFVRRNRFGNCWMNGASRRTW